MPQQRSFNRSSVRRCPLVVAIQPDTRIFPCDDQASCMLFIQQASFQSFIPCGGCHPSSKIQQVMHCWPLVQPPRPRVNCSLSVLICRALPQQQRPQSRRLSQSCLGPGGGLLVPPVLARPPATTAGMLQLLLAARSKSVCGLLCCHWCACRCRSGGIRLNSPPAEAASTLGHNCRCRH